MGKIKSIKERVPQEVTLPDGNYLGTWGGYVITMNYNGKTYELETEEGVRGFNIKVMVTINNGEATFHELKN